VPVGLGPVPGVPRPGDWDVREVVDVGTGGLRAAVAEGGGVGRGVRCTVGFAGDAVGLGARATDGLGVVGRDTAGRGAGVRGAATLGAAGLGAAILGGATLGADILGGGIRGADILGAPPPPRALGINDESPSSVASDAPLAAMPASCSSSVCAKARDAEAVSNRINEPIAIKPLK